MPKIRCRNCKTVYETDERKTCPRCGTAPKVRSQGRPTKRVPLTRRGPAAPGAGGIAGTVVKQPPWWTPEYGLNMEKSLSASIKPMRMKKGNTRPQFLYDLQVQELKLAKKVLKYCPKCGGKIKFSGASAICSKCGFQTTEDDMLSHAYLTTSFAMRPLLAKEVVIFPEMAALLLHLAVYLGKAPDFDNFPDDWRCLACGMPKKEYRRLGKRRWLWLKKD